MHVELLAETLGMAAYWITMDYCNLHGRNPESRSVLAHADATSNYA